MKKDRGGNPFAIKFPGDIRKVPREGENVLDNQDFLIKRETERLNKEIWEKGRK